MLNENDASPLYQQLTVQLRADIQNGKYRSGEKIPTELALSKIYTVSRATVRSALDQLAQEKLVTRKQGKGTFVATQKFNRNIAINTSFSEVCAANGKEPGARVLKCMIEPANAEDIRDLKLKEGDSVIVLERIRYASGVPVSVESSRMPEQFSFLLQENMNDASLIKVLQEKYSVVFYPGSTEIELAFATHEIAKYLGIRQGYPLISIASVSCDSTGRPIHRSQQLVVGDKFKFYI